MQRVRFVKMHGAGNDFVLIDDRAEQFPVHDHLLLAALAAPRTGIACEGVILVQPSKNADFKMVFFNPDGTEADLCGNGARCVAAFAKEIGAAKSSLMTFETRAGLVDAEVLDAGHVKVWMPEPKDRRYGLNVEGTAGDFIVAGVPHFVVPCERVANVDVNGLGRKLRLASAFEPAGRMSISCSSVRPTRPSCARMSVVSRPKAVPAVRVRWRRPLLPWRQRACPCRSMCIRPRVLT